MNAMKCFWKVALIILFYLLAIKLNWMMLSSCASYSTGSAERRGSVAARGLQRHAAIPRSRWVAPSYIVHPHRFSDMLHTWPIVKIKLIGIWFLGWIEMLTYFKDEFWSYYAFEQKIWYCLLSRASDQGLNIHKCEILKQKGWELLVK